jgi:hypothetical protein
MIRSAFNVGSTLSLLLGCAIAAAWVCGRSTPRAFGFGYKGKVWPVVTDGGRLRVDKEAQPQLDSALDQWLARREQKLREEATKAAWLAAEHVERYTRQAERAAGGERIA